MKKENLRDTMSRTEENAVVPGTPETVPEAGNRKKKQEKTDI